MKLANVPGNIQPAAMPETSNILWPKARGDSIAKSAAAQRHIKKDKLNERFEPQKKTTKTE